MCAANILELKRSRSTEKKLQRRLNLLRAKVLFLSTALYASRLFAKHDYLAEAKSLLVLLPANPIC